MINACKQEDPRQRPNISSIVATIRNPLPAASDSSSTYSEDLMTASHVSAADAFDDSAFVLDMGADGAAAANSHVSGASADESASVPSTAVTIDAIVNATSQTDRWRSCSVQAYNFMCFQSYKCVCLQERGSALSHIMSAFHFSCEVGSESRSIQPVVA